MQFTNDFTEHLDTNDKVIIFYEAMLNRHALVAGDGNPNTAWLDFGEGNSTTSDQTQTKTFSIDIVKTDDQNRPLEGAQFKIYDAQTAGNEVGVVPLLDSNDENPVLDEKDNPMYRRARADEMEAGLSVPIVVNGLTTVVGLDNGTYYLEEVVAPGGYNKLDGRQKFIISDANLEAIFNAGIFSTGSGVHVVNKTGTMLPETGGVGTTLFYVFGGVLAVAAVVLLVTKKRMGGME